MSLSESYDDSQERERKHPLAMDKRGYGKYVDPIEKPVCPYCAPAIKGGAPGDRWHDDKDVRHWVRVARIRDTANEFETVWTLDAACGAVFNLFVDAS